MSLLDETETLLLRTMLYHGGITTVGLAAKLLDLSEGQVNHLFNRLEGIGLVNRFAVPRICGHFHLFRPTYSAAIFLGHSEADTFRCDHSDESYCNGLLKFWFRTTHRLQSGESWVDGGLAFSRLLQDRALFGMVKNPRCVGETVVAGDDHISIYAFPPHAADLLCFVRRMVVRYASLSRHANAGLGFVVDDSRADDITKLLQEMSGGKHLNAVSSLLDMDEKETQAWREWLFSQPVVCNGFSQ